MEQDLASAVDSSPFESEEEARIAAAYRRRKERLAKDRHAYTEPASLFALQMRERRVLALLSRHGVALDRARIVEVGCGQGYWLRAFVQWGARPERLSGVELLPDRAAEARRLCAEATQIACSNAAALAWPDASCDVVLQSTVFSSILDGGMRQRLAAEMRRVLRPDGLILWYDFFVDNPTNRDVRGVRRHEIEALFPDCAVELERVTLAPPLTRLFARRSFAACLLLEQLPLLCTHYLGAIRPRGA